MPKVIEDYVLYEAIGSGQYGKVHRAVHRKTKQNYAVKVIPLLKFSQASKLEQFTHNETQILSRLKHPNIISFYEMFKTANNLYLIYEFCGEGTLEDLISSRGKLPEPEALLIFQQILRAFSALYKENILHRDLKPTNIIFQKTVVKVADFGFCKRLTSQNTLTLTMVGSPLYMAPEILKGYPYSTKSDIWSLGVVLYETLFGICPYEGKTLAGLIEMIERNKLIIPKEQNGISLNTESLLRKLLTVNPAERIDWQSLLSYDLQIPHQDIPREIEMDKQRPKPLYQKIQRNSIINTENNNNSEDAKEAIYLETASPKKNIEIIPMLSENSELLNMSQNPSQIHKSASLTTINNSNVNGLQILKEFPTEISSVLDGIQERCLDYSEIVTQVLLERNKGIFLTSVLTSVFSRNISKMEHCALLIAKRAYNIWKDLLNELSAENKTSKYHKYEDWELFIASEDYDTLCDLLNEELRVTAIFYEEIRATVGYAIDKYEDFDAQVKTAIIAATESEKANMILYCRQLAIYAEELKARAKEALNKGESNDDVLEILVHANGVVDAAALDSFASKYLSQKLNWKENEYFKNIRRYSKERLLDLVTVKIDSLKAKLILSPK